MQRRRRMRAFRTVTVPAVAAVLIAVAAVTSGSVIPGGGPLPLGDAPFTDCYLYVRTNGTLTPNNQKFFVCEDGDPTCDQDRQCDGACTFSAALCEGLAGSSAAQAMVAGCEPPPGLDRLHLSKGCPLDAPEDLGGSACGAFVTFQVELKGSRQQRVNRRRCTARARATVDGKKRVDSDVYVFTCMPGCQGSPSGAFIEGTAGDG